MPPFLGEPYNKRNPIAHAYRGSFSSGNTLAVIGKDKNNRIIVQAIRFQLVQSLLDKLVGIIDTILNPGHQQLRLLARLVKIGNHS